jgi:LPXTG-motif cell wall-anchored protein
MRWKMSAGVLVALALLIPAAPAMAQTEKPGLNQTCQTGERKLYKDIRKLLTIDLDTATDTDVRVLAGQILTVANDESLPVLPDAIQDRLDGTPEDLRAFLKDGVLSAWLTDLRISVTRTLVDAGTNVSAAAQKVLDDGDIDTFLVYLNEDLYAVRALDCASHTTPPTGPTPGPTKTAAPVPTASASAGASDGEDGGLPVTGSATGTVALIGGALLLLGGVGYLIGRRRRSRFVA